MRRLASRVWLAVLAVACPALVGAQVPDEATDLTWCAGPKTCLTWTAPPTSTSFRLYRGESASLPCAVHAALDSCERDTFTTTDTGGTLAEVPGPGRLYWYVVTAVNASGEGTPGNAGPLPRRIDASGSCPGSCAAAGAVCTLDEDCCSWNCAAGFCDGACSGCPAAATCGQPCTYGTPSTLAVLHAHTFPDPDEVSGLAQSRVDNQVLWMHNDDDGVPAIFAFSLTGSALGIYYVDSAWVTDPEDIAAGPGPVIGEAYLYLGDVGGKQSGGARIWGCTEADSSNPLAGCGDCPSGSNCRQRDMAVLRIVEPDVSASQTFESVSGLTSDVISFQFPDSMLGRLQDVETLMLDPLTLDLYFVTKSTVPPVVFRASYPYSGTAILEEVAELAGFGKVTGGDVSSDGHYVAIRTADTGYVWERPLGTDLGDVFSQTPCGTATIFEPQGEALGLDVDNSGSFYTFSEKGDGGVWIPLYRFPRN